jgi:hypothetical protein
MTGPAFNPSMRIGCDCNSAGSTRRTVDKTRQGDSIADQEIALCLVQLGLEAVLFTVGAAVNRRFRAGMRLRFPSPSKRARRPSRGSLHAISALIDTNSWSIAQANPDRLSYRYPHFRKTLLHCPDLL